MGAPILMPKMASPRAVGISVESSEISELSRNSSGSCVESAKIAATSLSSSLKGALTKMLLTNGVVVVVDVVDIVVVVAGAVI